MSGLIGGESEKPKSSSFKRKVAGGLRAERGQTKYEMGHKTDDNQEGETFSATALLHENKG